MKIDIISDIHLDDNLNDDNLKINDFENEDDFFMAVYLKIFKSIIPKKQGEVLIIAGDLGEEIFLIKKFFSLLMKHYSYKKVFYVFGNHELYFTVKEHSNPLYTNFKQKIFSIKESLYEFKNVHVLDGDIVEYKGIKFGGATGWYDGKYSNIIDDELTNDELNAQWVEASPDSYIEGLDRFDQLVESEMKKVDYITKNSHVVITHISPLLDFGSINPNYKTSIMTGFYNFDGNKFLNPNIKFWVYGHSHDFNYFEKNGITFIRNPYGFKTEVKSKNKSYSIHI